MEELSDKLSKEPKDSMNLSACDNGNPVKTSSSVKSDYCSKNKEISEAEPERFSSKESSSRSIESEIFTLLSRVNYSDQMRLSPEGNANPDSAPSENLSDSPVKKAEASVVSHSVSYSIQLPSVTVSNCGSSYTNLTPEEILANGNPGIRVVVGAADDSYVEKDKASFISSSSGMMASCSSATIFQSSEATWSSKTTTTTLTALQPQHSYPHPPMEPPALVPSTANGNAIGMYPISNVVNGNTYSHGQHLEPKSHFSGGAGSHRKLSPNRRRYAPPRSRGNSPCGAPVTIVNGGIGATPIHPGSPSQGKSQNAQIGSGQHVVHLHVNPGETISFQIGEQVELIQGPATVRMVSSNSTPPVPMPVQVPPGHMVQQIVDENGTLRHIILSPQPTTMAIPPIHPHSHPHLANSNNVASAAANYTGGVPTVPNGSSGSSGSSGSFFGYPPPPPFVSPQFHHPHMQPGTGPNSGSGISPPSSTPIPPPNLNSGLAGSLGTHQNGIPGHVPHGGPSSNGQHHHVHLHHHHHHGVTTPSPSFSGNNNPTSPNSSTSQHGTRSCGGFIPNTTSSSSIRDDRTQKQFHRLKRKLEARNQREGLLILPPSLQHGGILPHPTMMTAPTAFFLSPANSPKKGMGIRQKSSSNHSQQSNQSFEGGTDGNVGHDEDEIMLIKDALSKLEAPTVSSMSSRHCFLCWSPLILNETTHDREQETIKPTGDEVDRQSTQAGNELPEKDGTTNHHNNNFSLLEKLNEMGIDNPVVVYKLFLTEKISHDEQKETRAKVAYCGSSTECEVQGLKPSTDYHIVLQASIDGMHGSPSLPLIFHTEPSEPDKPHLPKLVSKTKNSLMLKWTPPPDCQSKLTNYILEYDEGKGQEFVEVFNGLQKQFKVTKLNPTTSYRFRLAAVNSVGKSEYSNVVSFSTSGSAPTQPIPPFLKQAYVNRLHLEWSKRIPMDEDFTLQMDDETTRHGFLPIYNGRESNYCCTGLKRNFEYKFRLCANNEEGTSPWSKTVAFRTFPDRPGPPGKPMAKGKIHANQIRFDWEPPKDDGGSLVETYTAEIDSGSGFEPIYTGPERECQCNGLNPGTIYHVRVSCCNVSGQGQFSETSSMTTNPICPGKCFPPRLQGKPKALMLHLKWGPPDNDGGAAVSDYEVNLTSPDNTTRLAYNGRDTDCVVAGLLPGRPYLFQVRASNRAGAGPWSDSLEAVSGAGPPDPPSQLQAVSKSPSSVLLMWEEPLNNGASILDYKVEWAQKVAEGTEIIQFFQVNLGSVLSHEVKNLSPATTYVFRVQASNSAGSGLYSSLISCLTQSSSPGPVSSSNLELVSCGANHFSLSWKEPPSLGASITHYHIEAVALPSGDTVLKTSTETNVQFDSLVPETTYRVRVQAVNSIGPGTYSSSVKVTTKCLPPSPPVLECQSSAHNSLRLKWGEGKNQDFLQYVLEMENAFGSFLPVYQGALQSYKVSKLQEATTYRFRLMASNEAGDGPYSPEYTYSTVRAVPPAPKAPKVSWNSSTSCTLEWSSVKINVEDPITYVLQLQKGKEVGFQKCYEGKETCYSLDGLNSKWSYSVRVAVVRHCTNGELLQSAWCPLTAIGYPDLTGVRFLSSNLNEEGTKSGSSMPLSIVQRRFSPFSYFVKSEHKELTDQQLIGIALCAFLLFGFLAAMAIEHLLSYSKQDTKTN